MKLIHIFVFAFFISTNTLFSQDFELQSIYYVNSGGSEIIDDETWLVDDDYIDNGTSKKTYGEFTGTNNTNVPNSAFQWMRLDDNIGYSFPVHQGYYLVKLYFAETSYNVTQAGQRTFDINLEHKLVLKNFDIVEEVGWKTVAEKTFTSAVVDGELNLSFVTGDVGDAALISAVAIYEITNQELTALTLEKSEIDFGKINLGNTSNNAPIKVSNQNSTAIEIANIDLIYQNNFVLQTVVNLPHTLAAGETATIAYVRFQPDVEEITSNTLTIQSDALNQFASISLNAEGLDISDQPCGAYVPDDNNIFVFELEDYPDLHEKWVIEDSISDYGGSGYLVWTGGRKTGTAGFAEMNFKLNITDTGRYEFRVRSRKPIIDPTIHNDIWVKTDTRLTFRYAGQYYDTLITEPNTWLKSIGGSAGSWGYTTNYHDKESNEYYSMHMICDTARVYTFSISARSTKFPIDRVVISNDNNEGGTIFQAKDITSSSNSIYACEGELAISPILDQYIYQQAETLIPVHFEYASGDLSTTNYSVSSSNPNIPVTLTNVSEYGNGFIKILNPAIGNAAIVVTAIDSTTISTSFNLTVNPKAVELPTFSVDDLIQDEDSEITHIRPVLDNQTLDVVWSIVGPNLPFATRTFNTETGGTTFNVVDHGYGSGQYTLKATYNQHEYSEQFIFTVNSINDPPLFELDTNRYNISEDFDGMLAITPTLEPIYGETGVETLIWSVTNTDGLDEAVTYTLDQETGIFEFETIPNTLGDVTFKLICSDGEFSHKEEIRIIIAGVNDPPEFEVDYDTLLFTEDFVGEFYLQPELIAIEEGEIYTWSASTTSKINSGIDPNTGLVTFTSIPYSNGTEKITITCNDGRYNFNKELRIIIDDIQRVPEFSTSGDLILDEDQFTRDTIFMIKSHPALSIQEWEITPDPSTITWADIEFRDLRAQLIVDSNPNMYGSADFTITAHNGLEYSQNVNVTINPVNDYPTFRLAQSQINLKEDFEDARQIGITIDDYYGEIETLEWTINDLDFINEKVVTQDDLLWIELTSIPDNHGDADLIVSANDGLLTFRDTLAVNVVTINDHPTFSFEIIEFLVDENFPEEIIVEPIVDNNNESETYTWRISETTVVNVDFDESTGISTITSIPGKSGNATLYVTANDGIATYTQSFKVRVNSVLLPPTFTYDDDLTVEEDNYTTQILGPTVTNEFDPPNYWKVEPNPFTITFATIRFEKTTGELTIQPKDNGNGSQNFVIIADNGLEFSEEVLITVSPVNDPATFKLSKQEISEQQDFTKTFYIEIQNLLIENDENVDFSYRFEGPELVTVNIVEEEVLITSKTEVTGTTTLIIISDDGVEYEQSLQVTINDRVNSVPTFYLNPSKLYRDQDFEEVVAVLIKNLKQDPYEEITFSYQFDNFNLVNVTHDNQYINLTSIEDVFGEDTLRITAFDGELSYTKPLFISIEEFINNAPTFQITHDKIIFQQDELGETIAYIKKIKVDKDDIITIFDNMKYGNIVNYQRVDTTLIFSTIPGVFGEDTLTITVFDGELYSEKILPIQVQEKIVNPNAPTFVITANFYAKQDFEEISQIEIRNLKVDEDDVITFSYYWSDLPLTNVNIVNQFIELSSIEDAFGTGILTIVAKDEKWEFEKSINVRIDEVPNNIPTFVLSPTKIIMTQDQVETKSILIKNVKVDKNELITFEYQLKNNIINYDVADTIITFSTILTKYGLDTLTVTSFDGELTYIRTIPIEIKKLKNTVPIFILSRSRVLVDENFAEPQGIAIRKLKVDKYDTIQFSSAVIEGDDIVNLEFTNDTLISITSKKDMYGESVYAITSNDGEFTYTKELRVIVDKITGLFDVEVDISVYPNPVTNGIISIDYTEAAIIQIFNLQGILKQHIKYEGGDINVVNLKAGTYILSINNDKVSSRQKLLVY